ncbi:flagellar hook-associated protein FlgK [Oceaniglobus indicus]|uniref:flagellar hook-associated protein FlgK n=1 Tax=Oceaniglobus indicus TaxID=2047749 RepID=UPI000C17B667|nr:flagellar hook-associated protein FlgK [Oceaniglobus indicus]
MSMSAALANALTGLGAVGRSAQSVSSNISNSLTEGFGRREISLSSASLGGVRVSGELRIVNAVVLSDRRQSDAEVGMFGSALSFHRSFQDALGAADSPFSLPGRIATLEGRLIEAASRPDATTRLDSVAHGAADLARSFNTAATAVQAQRLSADGRIAAQVDTLKTNLGQIRDLNGAIARIQLNTPQSNALLDQRQQLIDEISMIVPLRELPRDRGSVALMTTGGQVLLDNGVADIEFSPANAVTPGMTPGSGLSDLTINGRPIVFRDGTGRMDGGSLAGDFQVRDVLAPAAQDQLDDLAADLIGRFQQSGLDSTLGAGDAGLFTDGGDALVPPASVGLAQRLTLNARVDPGAGGEAWRLRDGINANIPGPVGNSALLQGLSDALGASRPAFSDGRTRSAAGHASELLSVVGGANFRAEQASTFAQSRSDTLRQRELAGGVDSDQEMQKLLLIEQSYAANARVIQAVDEMLRRLTEI